MKYIVIDDSETDRMVIEAIAANYHDLECAASFANPLEAVSFIVAHKPDLLFLDIEMPLINGVDFLRSLKTPPLCVFITSHPEFAIDAFELFALDYILKPITPERFDAAFKRVKSYLNIQAKAMRYEHFIQKDTITIHEGYDTYRLPLSDITHLEALKDYTKIYTAQKNYIASGNIGTFVQSINVNQIIRVHRSYAVNSSKIDGFVENDIVIGDAKIPVGKTYKKAVNEIRKKG